MPDVIRHPELVQFTGFRLTACRNDDVKTIMRPLIKSVLSAKIRGIVLHLFVHNPSLGRLHQHHIGSAAPWKRIESPPLSPATAWLLGECMPARGQQEMWMRQRPEVLAAFREQAIFQSAEPSNFGGPDFFSEAFITFDVLE